MAMSNNSTSRFRAAREIWTELFTGRDKAEAARKHVKLDPMPCPPKDQEPRVPELLVAEAQLHRQLVWSLVGSSAPLAADAIFRRGHLILPALLVEFAAARKRLARDVYDGRSRDEALSARITVLIRAIRAIRV